MGGGCGGITGLLELRSLKLAIGTRFRLFRQRKGCETGGPARWFEGGVGGVAWAAKTEKISVRPIC